MVSLNFLFFIILFLLNFVLKLSTFSSSQSHSGKMEPIQKVTILEALEYSTVLLLGRNQTGYFPVTGWTSSGQWPADRRQRRVAAGKNQPGRHGDAPQVHVNGGEQARDDPADCRSASHQTERGETGWNETKLSNTVTGHCLLVLPVGFRQCHQSACDCDSSRKPQSAKLASAGGVKRFFFSFFQRLEQVCLNKCSDVKTLFWSRICCNSRGKFPH